MCRSSMVYVRAQPSTIFSASDACKDSHGDRGYSPFDVGARIRDKMMIFLKGESLP